MPLGVVEGPDGPEIFDGEPYDGAPEGEEEIELREEDEDGGGMDGMDSGMGEAGGGPSGVRRRSGKKADAALWADPVRKAATTTTACPLLSRFCVLSNRKHPGSLALLVDNLVGRLLPFTRQLESSSPKPRLQMLLEQVEGFGELAKLTDLNRMFASMNLALELDQ